MILNSENTRQKRFNNISKWLYYLDNQNYNHYNHALKDHKKGKALKYCLGIIQYMAP